MLEKLQKRSSGTVGPTFTPLVHRRSAASLSPSNKYYFNRYSCELVELVQFFYSRAKSVTLADGIIFVSPFLDIKICTLKISSLYGKTLKFVSL